MDGATSFGRTKRGYSLIEILFSLVLITGGIVAASALIMHAGRTETHSRHRLAASSIAQDVLGQMESGEFDDISTSTEEFSAETITQRCLTAKLPSPVVTVDIGPYPSEGTQYLKKAVITIEWGAAGPTSKGRVQLESLFAADAETIWNG